jgi:flagellar hook-length control protein FliK
MNAALSLESLAPIPPAQPASPAGANPSPGAFEEHLQAEPIERKSAKPAQPETGGAPAAEAAAPEASPGAAAASEPPKTQEPEAAADEEGDEEAASEDGPRAPLPWNAAIAVNVETPSPAAPSAEEQSSVSDTAAPDSAAAPAATPQAEAMLPGGDDPPAAGDAKTAAPPSSGDAVAAPREARTQAVARGAPRHEAGIKSPTAIGEAAAPANAEQTFLKAVEDVARKWEDITPATEKPETAAAAEQPLSTSAKVAEVASARPDAAAHQESQNDAPHDFASRGADDGDAFRLAAADRVRFVQRVARAVEAARPDGEIRLRLRPPELGAIHLRVKTEDGVLAARVETETPQARSLLTERLPELRERLAEMNIRLERFDVEWRGGGAGQSPAFAQQGGSGGHNAFEHGSRGNASRQSSATSTMTPPRPGVRHRGDLDVVV